MNRAGIVCVAACAGAVALLAGTDVAVRAAGARMIQVAELPDMALSTFHNGVFRFAIDQIVDDHGLRLGSLGSDIFHDPDDSYNEFWAITDRGPNGNPGMRTFVAPRFNPEILHVRAQSDRITILSALPILDASGLPVTGLPNVETFDETPFSFDGTSVIGLNPNGLDTEGIVRVRDQSFWLVDEYSPSLVHVNRDGRILDRFVPEDSQLASVLATTPNYRVRSPFRRSSTFDGKTAASKVFRSHPMKGRSSSPCRARSNTRPGSLAEPPESFGFSDSTSALNG